MHTRAKSKKIKVGFDFDGVIFYNATRNVRGLIYFVKRYFLGIRKTKFYLPKTKNPWVIKLVTFLHKSSYKPNKGFELFLQLLKNPKYEVYIITARMSFMKQDIYHLLSKYSTDGIKQIIQNQKDEQPHLYKERNLKQLNLDYYFDDNWDIVEHLAKKTKAKIIWIDNWLDSLFIKYPYKGRNLSEAFKYLK